MTQNQNLPGAGDRTLTDSEKSHQEQAFGLVMAIVPATFIILVVALIFVH